MPNKVIVMVADKEDGKRGEITLLEDTHKAEVLIETLLEAGFEQERIRLFTGEATAIEVNYRPVVALVDGEEAPPAIEPPRRELVVATAPEPGPAAEDDEEAAPFVKNGVRFSSLFQTTDVSKIPTT